MRRLSTLSALAAAALALLFGLYFTQATHTGVAAAKAQAGFAPNTLLIQTELKGESYDAF
jgi:hypothetical protein